MSRKPVALIVVIVALLVVLRTSVQAQTEDPEVGRFCLYDFEHHEFTYWMEVMFHQTLDKEGYETRFGPYVRNGYAEMTLSFEGWFWDGLEVETWKVPIYEIFERTTPYESVYVAHWARSFMIPRLWDTPWYLPPSTVRILYTDLFDQFDRPLELSPSRGRVVMGEDFEIMPWTGNNFTSPDHDCMNTDDLEFNTFLPLAYPGPD